MTCCRSWTTLQRRGVAHRDIKPDNLGIAERGGKGKKRQLVLFDFSLAAEPLDAIDVGTRPYLDPFLGRGDRRTWDPAAERYAAAVTLYEMATARRPEYGSGAHPGFTDCGCHHRAGALRPFLRTRPRGVLPRWR